jgi:hypothetical protein
MTMQDNPAKGGFFHSVAAQTLLLTAAIAVLAVVGKYVF